MSGDYSKIPANTFQHIGVNAGVLLKDFDPTGATAVAEADRIGATTGGIQFQAQPEYTDWGEDIDNCPKNTKELKRFDDVTVTCSGTFAAIDAATAQLLAAHADISGNKVTPRTTIDIENDFNDLWIVGDYSDINTTSGSGTGATTAGFIAIHLMNAFSTGGFQLQTADKEKMQFAFEFTAHFSLDAQDTVPYEIYIKQGTKAA